MRFNREQIKQLLIFFNMKSLEGHISLYGGLGNDGIWRTCNFDYNNSSYIIATGTANIIAHSLKFKNVLEMKKFIDENLKDLY